MTRVLIAVLVFGVSGCTSPDGSGEPRPTDTETPVVDPLADTDGDGLIDVDEPGIGTDPALFDTDGDTYGDGLEHAEGLDPLDRGDRFYEGFWPYNPAKDSLVDPGFDGEPVEVGDTFGRMVGVDQFGEEVDLYDFSGSGGYLVIDASATWCESCRKTASWMAGDEDEYQFEYFYADVRSALRDRRFQWVTFLTDNGSGPATPADVAMWHDRFPNKNMAVLTDQDESVLYALNFGESYSGVVYSYFPSFVVVDAEMNVVVRGFVWDAMDFIAARLAEEDAAQ